MLSKIKAKLRAWLIELVREAIRVERERVPFRVRAGMFDSIPAMKLESTTDWVQPASKRVTAIPVDFEQIQDESIAAQENYYDPSRK